jgi:hypothetical protein
MSLMNLPKVNASPSSHFHDRLQQSGAPQLGEIGTPGGRALPIPPGAAGSVPPVVGGPTPQSVGPPGGGGGGPSLQNAPPLGTPGVGGPPRSLPQTPGGPSTIPQHPSVQQTQNFYNQPQANGTLPNGFKPGIGGGDMLNDVPPPGLPKGAPGMNPQPSSVHPGIARTSAVPEDHQFGATQHHHVTNPPLTSPSNIQPSRDSLLLNRSDSDSETEWC